MSYRNGVRVAAALAAALAVSYAAHAVAGPSGLKARGRAARQANVFCLSANYTGYLSETLTINGVQYRVAPETAIYVVGQGLQPLGMMVYNRSVYIAGERRGKNLLVRSIVVRPAVSDAPSDGRPDAGKVTDPNPPM
jgi:hypothetical protein